MKIKNSSLKDLAIYISDYLSKNDIDAVLSGGACVSIYTDNKYISSDLDFVLFSFADQKKLRYVLEKIGFYEENRQFKHKDTEFFIEFLPPPPSVGEEPVNEISEIKKGDMNLKLLSPTDCVKDRLAAFYHWNDRQCLEQAILVCMDNPVDLKEVERWSRMEGMSNKFKIFRKRLKENLNLE